MEIVLTLMFWKIAAIVSVLGGLVVLPFFLGLRNSRHENRAFKTRLEDGYYKEGFNFPRHLTRVE